MIETQDYEQVTQIKMSREFDGKPIYWMAAYLIDGLLIDTGCHETSQELVTVLENRKLKSVVNTHYHEDHIGGNHDIMVRYGVDIFAHPTSIPKIATRFHLFPYQEFAFGYPVPTTVKPLSDHLKTDHFTFQIIETPGHCDGHICIVEMSKGWCFTGDLFTRESPKFIRSEENIGEIIRSMRKIVELPTEKLILFTSLGRIVEDGRKALTDCINYLSELSIRVKAMKTSGLSVDEIVNGVFGGENMFMQLTNGQFSTSNLITSLFETCILHPS